MLVNLILLCLGAWGLRHTWRIRAKAGSSLFLDLASPVRRPILHVIVVALNVIIFGLCAGVGGYRLIFGINT